MILIYYFIHNRWQSPTVATLYKYDVLYEQNYNNCYESIEEMQRDGLTRQGIFDFIAGNYDSFDLTAREKGVYLNGVWIKPPKDGDDDDPE